MRKLCDSYLPCPVLPSADLCTHIAHSGVCGSVHWRRALPGPASGASPLLVAGAVPGGVPGGARRGDRGGRGFELTSLRGKLEQGKPHDSQVPRIVQPYLSSTPPQLPAGATSNLHNGKALLDQSAAQMCAAVVLQRFRKQVCVLRE